MSWKTGRKHADLFVGPHRACAVVMQDKFSRKEHREVHQSLEKIGEQREKCRFPQVHLLLAFPTCVAVLLWREEGPSYWV